MSGPQVPSTPFSDPAPTREAAGYLIEMLSSMSHFATATDLHNSAVMLAAAARVLDQECRLVTEDTPISSAGEAANWPFPYGRNGEPVSQDDPEES